MKKTWKKALGYKNLAGSKTQYYSNEFKKEYMKYKTLKVFNLVENLLQKNWQFI